jgi:predicted kinase
MATLIVFSGLPASGKSSIARALAQKTGAIWLRKDSIEQAIRDSGAWDRDHVTVDTTKCDVAACVELILAAISAGPIR